MPQKRSKHVPCRETLVHRRTPSPRGTPLPSGTPFLCGQQSLQTQLPTTTPSSSGTTSPSGPQSMQPSVPNTTPSIDQSAVDPIDESPLDTLVSTGLKKNTRGLTHGLQILKAMVSNYKVCVQVRDGDMHAYGDQSSPFANRIGIAVRNFVSP